MLTPVLVFGRVGDDDDLVRRELGQCVVDRELRVMGGPTVEGRPGPDRDLAIPVV